MKKLNSPIDKLGIIRFLHLHCFIHIYRVFFTKDASDQFSAPRFQLFKPIKNFYQRKESKYSLFFNILFSFQNEIIVGSIVTLIFASCNLLVPQLIKSFLHFMHEHHVNKSEVASAQSFIQKFFIVQFLRIIFGQHAKRLFNQLAIQIQSSLCKKLIRKSLTLQRSCRDRIPKSQILQLQNVDLKLIFLMFKNMYLVIEAPFTIVVAIILLFRQSHIYGLIGIYWFVIAFLVQRELDSKMKHCNQTKLSLINERSKINYQLFGMIKEAKIIHYEDLIVQKNNDLFIQENHDHQIFYHYSTLYDITLLILPIVVVVTISLFDMNRDHHITVEQVYIMLELLGICYNPMKAFRTITISFHDGFISLSKLQQFFSKPDEFPSTLIKTDISVGQIVVQQGTVCSYTTGEFQLNIKHHIELKKGDILLVLGKKNQGKTSFLRMILGQMKHIQGTVFINSKKAASFDRCFIRKATILQNIVFEEQPETQNSSSQYRQKVRQAEILFKQFGLEHQFASKQGINTLVDEKSLTKKQMKKISLARAFVSNPDIYFLQSPFAVLDKNAAFFLQKKLRQEQKQGKTILMTETSLQYVEEDDHILIFQDGASIEYDLFKNLVNDRNSQVSFYFKSKGDKEVIKQPDSGRKIIGKFKNRVLNAVSFVQLSDESNDEDSISTKRQQRASNSPYLKYRSMSLAFNLKKKKRRCKDDNNTETLKLWKYFKFYMKSVPLTQLILILLIIGVAEYLHIFIHYYIGHLDEQQQNNPYLQFQNILILQVVLTLGLALIVYFQGEVSSLISIIQGNKLYQQSITTVVKKPIKWFYKQFAVKLADKFNHDYEEIFIGCHSLLNIYKNIVILIITIYVVSAGRSNIFVTIFLICIVYYSIGVALRKVQHKVVKHYYDYKYEFVKIFQECIDGGVTFQIFQTQDDALKRSDKVYKKLAAYKLAESYTSYGEELFCDYTSLFLLVIAFFYGLEIKLQGNHYNIALIGTTIHLLLNVSEVLKNIVKLIINFETFFNINIAPFVEQACDKETQSSNKSQSKPKQVNKRLSKTNKIPKKSPDDLKYDIQLQNVNFMDEDDKIILLKDEKINLTIKQQSTVSIFEPSEKSRAKLVQALTKNYQGLLKSDSQANGLIKFGETNIKDIPDEDIPDYVSVLMSNNFYWTGGTLRENVTWRKGQLTKTEEEMAVYWARQLKLDEDLKDFNQLLLDCPLSFNDVQTNNDFNKKLAVLRILIKKPKIIILKNTSSFMEQTSIIEMIKSSCFCTIIKVTGNSQQIPGFARIIYMENSKVLEDGKLSVFENIPDSKIGKLLEQINVQGYEFLNKAASPKRFKKKKDPYNSSIGFQTERSTFSQYSAY